MEKQDGPKLLGLVFSLKPSLKYSGEESKDASY